MFLTNKCPSLFLTHRTWRDESFKYLQCQLKRDEPVRIVRQLIVYNACIGALESFFCLGIIFFKSVEQLWNRCFIYEFNIQYIYYTYGQEMYVFIPWQILDDFGINVSLSMWWHQGRHQSQRHRADQCCIDSGMTGGCGRVRYHKLRDMCFMFVVTDLEYWNVNSKPWTTANIVKVQ